MARDGGVSVGSILELVEVHAAKAEWYGFVADAARDWDGRDPVRPAAPRALDLN